MYFSRGLRCSTPRCARPCGESDYGLTTGTKRPNRPSTTFFAMCGRTALFQISLRKPKPILLAAPGGFAFLEEGCDAFLRVRRHRVLAHYFFCVFVGFLLV